MADNRQKTYFGGLNKNYFPGQQGQGGINPYSNMMVPAISSGVARGVKTGYNPTYAKQVENNRRIEEMRNRQADAYISQDIDNLPSINWQDINSYPPAYKDYVNQFVKNAAINIGANQIYKRRAGDDDLIGKVELNSRISADMNKLQTLKQNLNLVHEKFNGFDIDWDNNTMSDMVDPDDKAFINDVIRGKAPMSFGDNGEVFFTRGDEQISVENLPDYFNKNFSVGKSMMTNLVNAYNKGKKLTDNELNLAAINLKESLSKGTEGDLLSIAFDQDVLGVGTSLLDKSQYTDLIQRVRNGDFDAEKELQNIVVQTYLERLQGQANAGFENQDPVRRGGGGSSSRSSSSSSSSSISTPEDDGTISGWYNTFVKPGKPDFNAMGDFTFSFGEQPEDYEPGGIYYGNEFLEDGKTRVIYSDAEGAPTVNDWKLKLSPMGYSITSGDGQATTYELKGRTLTYKDLEGYYPQLKNMPTKEEKENFIKNINGIKINIGKKGSVQISPSKLHPKYGKLTEAERRQLSIPVNLNDPAAVERILEQLK